jgi:hypothetical protein
VEVQRLEDRVLLSLGTNFEIDGNVTVPPSPPAPNGADWANIIPNTAGVPGTAGAGCPSTAPPSSSDSSNMPPNGNSDPTTISGTTYNWSCDLDLTKSSNDNSFGQGTKEDNSAVTIVSGSIPNNKSDLSRFYTSNYTAPTGAGGAIQHYLAQAWERGNTLGTANLDFEYNQKPTTFPSSGPVTIIRTTGDVLITFDFTQGGSVVTLSKLTWVTSGSTSQCASSNSLPCWGNQTTLGGSAATGSANDTGLPNFVGYTTPPISGDPASIVDPIGGGDRTAPVNLPKDTFGEALVNLEAADIFNTGTCTSFAQGWVKSRSSASFNAELKDFIAPVPLNVSNCGSITIVKDAIPKSTTPFPFSTTSSTTTPLPATFSIVDSTPGNGTAQNYPNLFAGTYTVSELVPSGWNLTGLTCSVTGSGGSTTTTNLGTATASINLAATDNVTCTYTDTALAELKVVKNTVGGDGTFNFTGTGPASNGIPASFSITTLNGTGNPNADFTNISPGSYTVAETVPSGWDLTNLSCALTTSGSGTSTTTTNLGTGTASITLGAGDTVTCTYTDTKRAELKVVKNTVGGDGTFSYTGTGPASNGIPASFSITTLNGTGNPNKDFTNIVPASYTVAEGSQTGWDLTRLSCALTTSGSGTSTTTTNLGTGTASITLGAGDTVTCTYTNTKRGSISIHKVDDSTPARALQGAVFTLYLDNTPFGPAGGGTQTSHGPEDTATTMTCTTDSSGNCTISNIPPNLVYWVVETTVPSGFQQAPDQNVLVNPGQAVGPLTFVDPLLFTVITVVCRNDTNQVYANGPNGNTNQVGAQVSYDGGQTWINVNNSTAATALCTDNGGARTVTIAGDHNVIVRIPPDPPATPIPAPAAPVASPMSLFLQAFDATVDHPKKMARLLATARRHHVLQTLSSGHPHQMLHMLRHRAAQELSTVRAARDTLSSDRAILSEMQLLMHRRLPKAK